MTLSGINLLNRYLTKKSLLLFVLLLILGACEREPQEKKDKSETLPKNVITFVNQQP